MNVMYGINILRPFSIPLRRMLEYYALSASRCTECWNITPFQGYHALRYYALPGLICIKVLRPFRAEEGGRLINIPRCGMLIYSALSGLFRYYFLQYNVRALKGRSILTMVIGHRYTNDGRRPSLCNTNPISPGRA